MSSVGDEVRREHAAAWEKLPPELRIVMGLRMGRMQLVAYAQANGLSLRAAAALIHQQVQATRRYSACLRGESSPIELGAAAPADPSSVGADGG